MAHRRPNTGLGLVTPGNEGDSDFEPEEEAVRLSDPQEPAGEEEEKAEVD